MSQDEFTKLFKYMQQEFAAVHVQLEAKNQRFDHMMSALDGIAKQQETDEQERLAIGHQLDRHDRWHHQLADKTNVKLSYE